jgi:hypothetical protein
MKKNYTVSLAKGIGIFGVVAHHLANRRFAESERPWIGLIGDISGWAVPLFIVVAGYLHGLSELTLTQNKPHFLISRIKRLIVPYILISFIYAVLYCLLITFGALSDPSVNNPKWYMLWFSSLTLNSGIGEQLYFLPLLFFISTASFFILSICQNRASLAVVVSFLVFITLTFLPKYESPIFQWSWQHISVCILIYLVGHQLSNGRTYEALYFAAASFACVLLLNFKLHDYYNFVFALALFSGLLSLSMRIRYIEVVGDASGTIFLYHTPFFIQSLLVLAATKLNSSLHIFSAYLIMLFTITFFTIFHFKAKGLGLSKITY